MQQYFKSNDNNTVTAICVDKSKIAAFFDIKRLLKDQCGRVLYLCHRDDTIARARRMFEMVLGAGYSYDNLDGTKSFSQKANVLFVTFQAMANMCEDFGRNEFRYIVVDETQCASVETLRPIVQYFTPEFMFGLVVATRQADDQGIGELFGGNLVVEPTLHEAYVPRHFPGDEDFHMRATQTPSATRNMRSPKLQTSAYRSDSQLIADLARYIRALGRVPKQHEVQYSRPAYLASLSTYVNRLGWPEAKRLALALLADEGGQFSTEDITTTPPSVAKAAPSPTQVFDKAKDLGRLSRVSEVEYVEVWQPDSSEWITDDTPTAGEFQVRQTSAAESTPAELLTQVLTKGKNLGRPPRAGEVDVDPTMASAREIKTALRVSTWTEVIAHIKPYL